MAHEVFISYSKEDWQTADVVCQALENEGIQCWYAPRDVLPGVAFEDAIVTAIYESHLMLLILSAHANNSRFVRRECACADEVEVPVLPLRIEDVRPGGALKLYLSSVQWLDAFIPPLESHLERLTKSVRIRLQREAERQRAIEEAQQTRAEETARRRAAEEADRRDKEEKRQQQEAEARRREEEIERQGELEERARLQAEEEARQRAETAAREKRKAEEAARRRAEEQALQQAKEEQRRLEEAARRAKEKAASVLRAEQEAEHLLAEKRAQEKRQFLEAAKQFREALHSSQSLAEQRLEHPEGDNEITIVPTPKSSPMSLPSDGSKTVIARTQKEHLLLTSMMPILATIRAALAELPLTRVKARTLRLDKPGVSGLTVTKILGRKRTLLVAGIAVVVVLSLITVVWLLQGEGGRHNSSGIAQTLFGLQSAMQGGSIGRGGNLITTAPSAKTTEVIKNSIGMELAWIPSGEFMMGSKEEETDERHVHRVFIGAGFYMGRYEVTQAEWRAVMESIPPQSHYGDNLPVENVSWNNAKEFIYELNKQDSKYVYRLPSESEWEYACSKGEKLEQINKNNKDTWALLFQKKGWFDRNSAEKSIKQTHPVGRKDPNDFGLYDMHGNVWEWCEDYDHTNYEGDVPLDGSPWQSGDASKRIVRGGSWDNFAYDCRCANRDRHTPTSHGPHTGLRLVAVARQ